MIAHEHYVEVVTDRGRYLVLMRLTDAVEVCGLCDGMRVHRSAWVSRGGMSDLIVKDRLM
ncbi:MAG: LytTR family DNA-binding domain-containing protein [Rhizobiaceae bacterium]